MGHNMKATVAGLSLVIAIGIASASADPAAKAAEPNPAGTGWSAQLAEGAAGITLDAAQSQTVKKIGDYFNTMKTLQGSFVQTAADGKVMKGSFQMMRPGMFRFDYARPSRQIIVSDGTNLAIQDLDLNNEDRIALDQTPFRVLLRNEVDLVRDAKINEVQETDTALLVALQDKSPDTPGRIKLVMAKGEKLQLKEWVTTDAQGLDTRVEVSDLKLDEKLEAERFVIKAVGNPFRQ